MTMRIRHDLQPGDVGRIITLHGELYAREHCFDCTFEAYVAGPLAEFVKTRTDRERIWLVDHTEPVMGCIAIVKHDEARAQLRWFLLHPSLRGRGLGKKLLGEAVAFCQEMGYESVFLWTVGGLHAAAGLYRAAGFTLTEEHERLLWGRRLVEQRYDLALR
ncbi:MAG: GNAT family N-acetyltransferase [Patescibacteria group bacterium]